MEMGVCHFVTKIYTPRLFILYSLQTVEKPNKYKAATNAELYCNLLLPICKINVLCKCTLLAS